MAKRGRSRVGSEPILRLKRAQGCTWPEAAKEAGMSESTARRRDSPEFRAGVEALSCDLAAAATGELVALYGDAVRTLHDLLGADMPPSVRCRAAVSILSTGARLQADATNHARLAVLESQAATLLEMQRELVARQAEAALLEI